MRTTTEEQARNYIKAGYFPSTTSIDEICDLQDVFGHQSVGFIKKTDVYVLDEDSEILKVFKFRG